MPGRHAPRETNQQTMEQLHWREAPRETTCLTAEPVKMNYSPLEASHLEPQTSWVSSHQILQVSRVSTLGLLYVLISAGMIGFNSHLMKRQRFPFAVPLVLCHTACSSVMTILLYLVRPTLFPSLVESNKKMPVDKNLFWFGVLPIAALFSVQLVLSNTAYLHTKTTFLQMMKESNIAFVYLFSLVAALDSFTLPKGCVLVFILLATGLTIHGEVTFSWAGFIIQGSGQLLESLRIVLQALLLSNSGWKLDALSYIMLVMPLCCILLAVIYFVLAAVHPLNMLKIAQWRDLATWWPELLANSMLAFLLNIVIAFFMKHTTPMGFVLAGIVKDACIVIAGALILGEDVTSTQVFGFIFQLGLVWTWSMMKLFPDKCDNTFCGIRGSVGSSRTKSEQQLLESQAAELKVRGP